MMKRRLVLFLLFALICTGCSNAAPDLGTTQPAPGSTPTASQPTVPPTTQPSVPPTTQPSVPSTTLPTEPTAAATVPTDPNALLSEEIEALEAIYTIYENLTQGFPHNWYNVTLGQVFDSPENLDVNNFFGHPGAVIPLENYELTDAEVDFLMNFPRMEANILITEAPVYRLARTDAEFLLKWYFDLELEKTNITDVYWEETDCYYFVLEAGGILDFEILEAKYLDEDVIWFRYRDASSPYTPDYEATIRVYRERFVLLSNKEVE